MPRRSEWMQQLGLAMTVNRYRAWACSSADFVDALVDFGNFSAARCAQSALSRR
ncbi:hypothetical protein [Deefgea piscis]|uniref:hypothetical protein n=1 Tax=Deefgea piscis TaxID=2739061 RepID=UPI001C7E4B3D|nr:hypothetical protein [Deefgea piscis]QZA81551.1 hypothetical protein K4H25_02480 [Deefgea piscis]